VCSGVVVVQLANSKFISIALSGYRRRDSNFSIYTKIGANCIYAVLRTVSPTARICKESVDNLMNASVKQMIYVARPQSKFPTRPTASKPYIARSDCAYVIEQCCSMAHALTVLPAFSQ
jgi:hypothetical protein